MQVKKLSTSEDLEGADDAFAGRDHDSILYPGK
jgi:hypothetical protein